MTDSTSTTKRIQRIKWAKLDGTAHEEAYICAEYHIGVDELEALGREALQVAAEWRKDIAERAPTPPTHKVFAFINYFGSASDTKIATWVEHPWALVRVGKGTSLAFLVKEGNTPGSYQAWVVVAKEKADGGLQWKCRFEYPTTVDQRDLLYVLPCALPYSPTLGDLEYARANAQRGAA